MNCGFIITIQSTSELSFMALLSTQPNHFSRHMWWFAGKQSLKPGELVLVSPQKLKVYSMHCPRRKLTSSYLLLRIFYTKVQGRHHCLFSTLVYFSLSFFHVSRCNCIFGFSGCAIDNEIFDSFPSLHRTHPP